MWKAWVGFNASHSLGAVLFALVYGYLALADPAFLFGSWFLIAVGFGVLLSYSVLAKIYRFSAPFTASRSRWSAMLPASRGACSFILEVPGAAGMRLRSAAMGMSKVAVFGNAGGGKSTLARGWPRSPDCRCM